VTSMPRPTGGFVNDGRVLGYKFMLKCMHFPAIWMLVGVKFGGDQYLLVVEPQKLGGRELAPSLPRVGCALWSGRVANRHNHIALCRSVAEAAKG